MVAWKGQKTGLIAGIRAGRGFNKIRAGADLPKMEKIFSF
jgi:hypothetical protein